MNGDTAFYLNSLLVFFVVVVFKHNSKTKVHKNKQIHDITVSEPIFYIQSVAPTGTGIFSIDL